MTATQSEGGLMNISETIDLLGLSHLNTVQADGGSRMGEGSSALLQRSQFRKPGGDIFAAPSCCKGLRWNGNFMTMHQNLLFPAPFNLCHKELRQV